MKAAVGRGSSAVLLGLHGAPSPVWVQLLPQQQVVQDAVRAQVPAWHCCFRLLTAQPLRPCCRCAACNLSLRLPIAGQQQHIWSRRQTYRWQQWK